MAVDEAILEAVGVEGAPTTLRLFAWDPPCLSLGYAQPASDANFDRLDSLGWHIVRRATGGRAILHTDELTYSVIGPHKESRLAGGVLESYRVLSKALLGALHLLNIPAKAHAQPQRITSIDPKDPICFEIPSNFEITVSGKKLIGSAQSRKRAGILQHGTLPLYGDLSRITQVLKFDNEAEAMQAADRLLNRATTVEEVLGQRPSWDRVAQAFVSAFQDKLNLEIEQGELTQNEKNRTVELVREKYGNIDWTKKT
jgi:lipoate-protein ligase A